MQYDFLKSPQSSVAPKSLKLKEVKYSNDE